jgi:putative ABC transport system substrate-binding protein
MPRRAFLASLVLGALPLPARAGTPVDIACLSSPPPDAALLPALRAALVRIDPALTANARFTEDFASFDPARLRQLARNLDRRRPDLIVCFDFDAASAVVAARTAVAVPVVFRAHDDPLTRGLIASYARPGRNVTGVTTYRCLDDKLVELMADSLPAARRMGFLHDGSAPDGGCNARAHRYARQRGITLIDYDVADAARLRAVLAGLEKARVDALIVGASAATWRTRKEIVARMDALALPAIYEGKVFVDDGGLMQFIALPDDAFERMARAVAYVARHGAAGDFHLQRQRRWRQQLPDLPGYPAIIARSSAGGTISSDRPARYPYPARAPRRHRPDRIARAGRAPTRPARRSRSGCRLHGMTSDTLNAAVPT